VSHVTTPTSNVNDQVSTQNKPTGVSTRPIHTGARPKTLTVSPKKRSRLSKHSGQRRHKITALKRKPPPPPPPTPTGINETDNNTNMGQIPHIYSINATYDSNVNNDTEMLSISLGADSQEQNQCSKTMPTNTQSNNNDNFIPPDIPVDSPIIQKTKTLNNDTLHVDKGLTGTPANISHSTTFGESLFP
jgi:hypothetical protein